VGFRRRDRCPLGAAAFIAPFTSRLSSLGNRALLPPDRALAFYNTHTAESAAVEFCRAGVLVPLSLEAINHILRDTWTGEVKEIDVGPVRTW
jgi:uncharacterized protein YcbK (DUF882 family)